MGDRDLVKCPDCGAEAERTLSAFSAVTGSGCSSDLGESSGSCCDGPSCSCGN